LEISLVYFRNVWRQEMVFVELICVLEFYF
jgi:hypothetical protein